MKRAFRNRSLRVGLGEHAHTGEALGPLGNSGNATGPRRHFRIVDGPSPLNDEVVDFK